MGADLRLLTLALLSIVAAGCGGSRAPAEQDSPIIPRDADGARRRALDEPADAAPDAAHGPPRRPPETNTLPRRVADSTPPSTRAPVTLASDAIQPHMAIGEGGIYVVFIHQGNIALSVSSDHGQTFSPPVIAIDVQGRARGGAHRGPRIGVDAKKRLTVTAPVTFDDSEYKRRYPTADLFFVRSKDGGRTWSPPVQVNEVSKKAPEALHWMTVAPSGEAHVAWLDLRSRKQSGQDIYYARLADGKVGRNVKVAGTVCECCAPGLAVDANGNPFLAFREGGPRPSREIFARRSADGGRSFAESVQVNHAKTREHG